MDSLSIITLFIILLDFVLIPVLYHRKKERDKAKELEQELTELILESKRLDLELKKSKLEKSDLDIELKLKKLSKENIKTKDISCNEVFY